MVLAFLSSLGVLSLQAHRNSSKNKTVKIYFQENGRSLSIDIAINLSNSQPYLSE
jgi:hypothetical protein